MTKGCYRSTARHSVIVDTVDVRFEIRTSFDNGSNKSRGNMKDPIVYRAGTIV